MIFRKSKEDEQHEVTRVDPGGAPQPTLPTSDDERAGASVLTADVVMEGNIVTSGDLHLDGTIHGAVQAARIVIDTHGAVSGQVVAQEVVIRGRVIGPICGVRVHLVPGAQVEGDVMSQSIVVEDGAFIDGQIRHSDDPLGEWQQMWYNEDAEAEAESPAGTVDAPVSSSSLADKSDDDTKSGTSASENIKAE